LYSFLQAIILYGSGWLLCKEDKQGQNMTLIGKGEKGEPVNEQLDFHALIGITEAHQYTEGKSNVLIELTLRMLRQIKGLLKELH
jgi:hypothetical protein